MKLNSKKILSLKEQLGLTYQELADRCGKKDRQYIFAYIRDERPAGAKMFAKAFKMNEQDFLIFD